jgi:hypothetical protein
MIGMTAFRAISHEFACLAVRHDSSGNATAVVDSFARAGAAMQSDSIAPQQEQKN